MEKQKTGVVTALYNKARNIEPGDIIFLRGGDDIFAYGFAKSSPESPHKLKSIDEINKKKNLYLSSDNKGKIFTFDDCECFYFDFSDPYKKDGSDKKDGSAWGQRVHVKEWNKADKSVYRPTKEQYEDENSYCPIRELTEEAAKELVKEMGGDMAIFENYPFEKEIEKLLRNNRNIILHGAPGTGKTYLANKIAEDMNAETEFVQFHPSYDYTDFVEGLRPQNSNKDSENITFVKKDGLFKKFCEKALNNVKKNYVFIIDEINRGDLSKIFGELFFLIDPEYRVNCDNLTDKSNPTLKNPALKIKTQYANMDLRPNAFDEKLGVKDDEKENFGHFFVPDNVYIIGTMNDIDRSVDSMDFAFRRRFAFKEILASDRKAMFKDLKNLESYAGTKLDNLNKCISSSEVGLSSSYHIGPSYFLKLSKYVDVNSQNKEDIEKGFEALWKYHIKGVLQEYLRGMDNEKKLLEKLEEAYNNNAQIEEKVEKA